MHGKIKSCCLDTAGHLILASNGLLLFVIVVVHLVFNNPAVMWQPTASVSSMVWQEWTKVGK
jgi:hypothetical protein